MAAQLVVELLVSLTSRGDLSWRWGGRDPGLEACQLSVEASEPFALSVEFGGLVPALCSSSPADRRKQRALLPFFECPSAREDDTPLVGAPTVLCSDVGLLLHRSGVEVVLQPPPLGGELGQFWCDGLFGAAAADAAGEGDHVVALVEVGVVGEAVVVAVGGGAVVELSGLSI